MGVKGMRSPVPPRGKGVARFGAGVVAGWEARGGRAMTADLRLEGFERRMEVADGVVAPLGVARIREGRGAESAEVPLVHDQVDLLDEVGRRGPAMALQPGQVARLDRLDEGLEGPRRRRDASPRYRARCRRRRPGGTCRTGCRRRNGRARRASRAGPTRSRPGSPEAGGRSEASAKRSRLAPASKRSGEPKRDGFGRGLGPRRRRLGGRRAGAAAEAEEST